MTPASPFCTRGIEDCRRFGREFDGHVHNERTQNLGDEIWTLFRAADVIYSLVLVFCPRYASEVQTRSRTVQLLL